MRTGVTYANAAHCVNNVCRAPLSHHREEARVCVHVCECNAKSEIYSWPPSAQRCHHRSSSSSIRRTLIEQCVNANTFICESKPQRVRACTRYHINNYSVIVPGGCCAIARRFCRRCGRFPGASGRDRTKLIPKKPAQFRLVAQIENCLKVIFRLIEKHARKTEKYTTVISEWFIYLS